MSTSFPDPSGTYLRRLVAGRARARVAALGSPSLESLVGEEAADMRPNPDEVADRVKTTMEQVLHRMPPDEVGDPREFRRALGILLDAARRTAEKLENDPGAPLGPGETISFEAVILTDGTRPSLLLRKGAADPEHPLAGIWADDIAETREQMRAVTAAVGRVEPEKATTRNYFGTCWVVDKAKGLALTNLHVVEAMWRRLAHLMVRSGSGFRILSGAFVDFAGESGSLNTKRFRIVEAMPSGLDGQGLARLDAAMLRIEPVNGGPAEIPDAIPVQADLAGPLGELQSLCVVGYPGAPPVSAGVQDGVDWTWVNATLFGNRFGVKRLAPGLAHKPLGTLDDDAQKWVFGHDPTTLGGSSGSPILAWKNGGAGAPSAFGLHFAGATERHNLAHALGAEACVEELRRIGLPV